MSNPKNESYMKFFKFHQDFSTTKTAPLDLITAWAANSDPELAKLAHVVEFANWLVGQEEWGAGAEKILLQLPKETRRGRKIELIVDGVTVLTIDKYCENATSLETTNSGLLGTKLEAAKHCLLALQAIFERVE